MTSPREQLEAVAVLFTYPRADYAQRVEDAVACSGVAAPALLEFARGMRGIPLSDLQELYTSTFDLRPVCALDLGWHLFGEEYERGIFLARMRRELRAHGIPEMHELPDHLSHALLLLAKMARTDAEDFAAAIVAPGVERMLKSIPGNNLFACLPQTTQQLIMLHFLAVCEPASPQAEGARL